MEEKIKFNEMFPGLLPAGEAAPLLEETAVLAATVGEKDRSLALTLEGPADLCSHLEELKAALAESYGLESVTLELAGAGEAEPEALYDACREAFCALYPAARGILAGAEYTTEGESLRILLVNGGKEALFKYADAVAESLRSRFGRVCDLRIESRNDTHNGEKEAFRRTEELRRRAMATAAAEAPKKKKTGKKAEAETVLLGRAVKGTPIPMRDLTLESDECVIQGEVFAVNHREIKKRDAVVVSFDMTDHTYSMRVRQYMPKKDAQPLMDAIRVGTVLKVQGKPDYDRFEDETVFAPKSICLSHKEERTDNAPEKRVELHLHTRFSNMDALTDPAKVVEQAAKWGHRAIAVTDHGVAQAFPDMWHAGEEFGVKILYGVEAYFVNDIDGAMAVRGDASGRRVTDEFVAFDIETTGLSALNDEIIEFGAVIFREGKAAETFSAFVDPGRPIPPEITRLTGISTDMVRGQGALPEVLRDFLAFAGDRPIVAHNADFDMSFLKEACRRTGMEREFVSIDTLALSRALIPELKKYKLNIVADHLGLADFRHHRASDDAITCGEIYVRLTKRLAEHGVEDLGAVNDLCRGLRGDGSGGHMRHITLLARNKAGLKNLYKIISESHLKYFKRFPLVPKTLLDRHREGLLVGSACENSELFSAVVGGRSWQDLKAIAAYYDYLEIQPICNNMFMVRRGTARDEEQLREFNRTVMRLGKELGKPVCATGDVHFLRPEDEVFRSILLASKKFEDADEPLPLYFKSTDEMLEEFSYLGEEDCYDAVIRNPNAIADLCEDIELLPKKQLFAPKIENSAEDLKKLVYDKMHELYGDTPPDVVQSRVDTELNTILEHEYDVIYMSAQKLVADSLAHGYLVGSRGSVGSSIVAYLSGITEVNSLPAHYRCPQCRHSDFTNPTGAGCGADMPDAVCPVCGTKYVKDGFDIPFETFLGYPGNEKTPDIDLNFSGEYQARAHKYTEELFGSDHVFRAGTIGTVASKTAYGYVKKYLEERGRVVSRAEENRLTEGCVGVKRTTGQHPGGLVIIPQDMDVTDFCPVQHPADDPMSGIITTHFEYHCMEDNLLKLDELGHDDPTMIRMLEDLTGVDARQIPLDDPETMGIFKSPAPLGLPEDDPIIGKTGSFGIPEFGTGFTRQMLVDTRPEAFDILIRLSGFSHGTDVWLGNAQDLITSGTASVKETVGCRDDIMLYLISKGMEPKMAFKIMEAVRKGKVKKGGFSDGWEEKMVELGVPRWYIDSLAKIAYLFPKAHAVAYVMMAFRIAWFKVHRPQAFYAAYFYRRSQKDGFDAEIMTRGADAVREKIREIEGKDDATAKELDLLTTLYAVYEFYLRGFSFAPIDLYESDATKFLPVGEKQLRPPFVSISGLGETAANDLAAAAQRGAVFVSMEDVSAACTKVSQAHMEVLKTLGAFGDLPESSQLTLF